MNMEIDEVILKSAMNRKQPMDFERMKFLCYFAAGILGEIFGFVLLLVIVLAMAGVI